MRCISLALLVLLGSSLLPASVPAHPKTHKVKKHKRVKHT